MPPFSETARAAALVLAFLAGATFDSPAAGRVQTEERERPRPVERFNLGKERLALQGYDPVAYFPAGGGKPRKGVASLVATHRGVTYRFATEENRALFLAGPERYEPEYGGWCAYAMADGEKVAIDPESFLVTDGKLYLFFKAWYADTRAKWKKDEPALRAKADAAWKKIVEAPRPGG